MPGEMEPIVNKIPLSIEVVLGGCFGIAMYNSIEVYISILRTFRRHQGLYFWSAIAANTGIPLVSVSALLRFFDLAPLGPMSAVYILGWWLMVTGQSLVLYSRMHLVMADPAKLQWLLYMIIASFFIFQVSTSILFLLINFARSPPRQTVIAFDVVERVQIVGLTLQESLLSVLYVYESSSTLRPMTATRGHRVRTLFREIVGLCAVVIALDISLVVTQYTNHFHVQTAYKPVVYSIKLKVEAFVLNNLIALVRPNIHSSQLGTSLGTEGHHTVRAPWWLQKDTSLGLSGGSIDRNGNPISIGEELISHTNSAERNRIHAPK